MSIDIQIFAQQSVQQENQGKQFPVDFDDAWVMAGYTRKDNALRFLKERCDGLVEGKHYMLLRLEESVVSGGSSPSKYGMTIDAFKF